jgi:hypothetical protein
MSDRVYFPTIAFSVTILQELTETTVKITGSSRVFDRTPELFRPPRDLPNVGDEPVKIAAVQAVELLNTVEIAQGVPVKDDIAASFDLGDLVDGKADGLEQGDKGIHEQGRKQAAPDKGDGENVEELRLPQIPGDPYGNELMLPLDLLVEEDLFAANLVGELRFLPLKLQGQFLLQFFYGLDQVLQFVVHGKIGINKEVRRNEWSCQGKGFQLSD